MKAANSFRKKAYELGFSGFLVVVEEGFCLGTGFLGFWLMFGFFGSVLLGLRPCLGSFGRFGHPGLKNRTPKRSKPLVSLSKMQTTLWGFLKTATCRSLGKKKSFV